MDHGRYDVELVSLSDGPTVRRFDAPGYPHDRHRRADDDQRAVGRLVDHLRRRPPHVVHNHMYRAEVVGTRAALALGEAGLPRPYIVGTVHSSRVRSDEDRDLVRALTPPMDRLIAVSQAIVAKLETEGRDGRTGRAHLQRRRPLALRPPGGVLHAARGVRLRDRHAARRRRRAARAGEGPPDAARGLAVRPRAACPAARLLIVGEGSRREALEALGRGARPARRALRGRHVRRHPACAAGREGRLHRPARRRARP